MKFWGLRFMKKVNSNQQHIYLSSIFLELNPLLRYVSIFPFALSLYVCNSLAQLIWFFIHYFIKKKNCFALRNPVLRNWRILSLVILAHAMERLRTVYVSISRFKPKWLNEIKLCSVYLWKIRYSVDVVRSMLAAGGKVEEWSTG